MSYLVEYITESEPEAVQATVVSKGFACTKDELLKEVAREAIRQVNAKPGERVKVVSAAYYESREAAEMNMLYCYPKGV